MKQRATNLDIDRRGEWFPIVTRRDICEINASMHIYIRCRRAVMGYRRVVMGYLTPLFKVLQGPELIRHGWTGVGRLGKAKLLSAVQTLTLLIRGTWGNRNAVCLNDFRYVCGDLSHWLFLVHGWQLWARNAFFPPSLLLGQWDEIFHLYVRSVMFFTPEFWGWEKKTRDEAVTEGSSN